MPIDGMSGLHCCSTRCEHWDLNKSETLISPARGASVGEKPDHTVRREQTQQMVTIQTSVDEVMRSSCALSLVVGVRNFLRGSISGRETNQYKYHTVD